MLHIFQLTYIYCINKLVTCETTWKMKHLIFLLKNVTTWRQMLSVFRLIFKHFEISLNLFLVANTNQNEKKIASPSSVCHGLQENSFQVNQLYNVTWSNEGAFFIPIAPAFSQNVFSFSILLYSRIFCSDNLIRNAA